MIEHMHYMNIPDAVPGSVVRMTDSDPPVRVSIALMHTVTTPSLSFTVYTTGSNPTRITAINHNNQYYWYVTDILSSSWVICQQPNTFSVYAYSTDNAVINPRHLCCH